MGYYSTLLNQPMIKSSLTEKEFMEEWEKAKQELIGSYLEGFLDFYRWEHIGKNVFYLELEDGDTWAKHYADSQLVKFIASVIADDEQCLLEFYGEDGNQWGYLISKDSVRDVDYVKMVDGVVID